MNGLKVFGFSDVEFKAGSEGIYIPETSEIITEYITKVFQQKFMSLITSEIESKDRYYKFKVKKLNQLSFKNFDFITDFTSFMFWELGNVPTHDVNDVEELIQIHFKGSEVEKLMRPIIGKAREVQRMLPHTEIYLDLQAPNFLEDQDGNIVGADTIYIEKYEKGDEKTMCEYIWS